MAKKSKTDIQWTKLKAKCKEIEGQVKLLKKYNDELDEQCLELYKVFQTVSSLNFYKRYAGHIDNNEKWRKAFHKYNVGITNARIISE